MGPESLSEPPQRPSDNFDGQCRGHKALQAAIDSGLQTVNGAYFGESDHLLRDETDHPSGRGDAGV